DTADGWPDRRRHRGITPAPSRHIVRASRRAPGYIRGALGMGDREAVTPKDARLTAMSRSTPIRRLALCVGAAWLGAVTLTIPASACDLATAPTSRWSLVAEDAISWLKTPCGERFYSLGVNILDGGNGEHAKLGVAYTGYDWQRFAPSL